MTEPTFLIYSCDPCHGTVVVVNPGERPSNGGDGWVLCPGGYRGKQGSRFRFGAQEHFDDGSREIHTVHTLPDEALAEWVKYCLTNNKEGK